MIDFAAARRTMVDGQVRTYDVTDLRVLAAMLEVPRERFVPEEERAIAYSDGDRTVLKSKAGRPARRLLKPAVLARLIQAAEVEAGDRVLDVGCATGYSAAFLARLAGSVVALEEDPGLAATARQTLASVGAANVSVVTGPLAAGVPTQAPFNVILLDGATEIAPKNLFGQLANDGRLVCVVGSAPLGKGTIYRSAAGHVTGQSLFEAVAAVLPGFAKPAEFVF